MVTTMLHDPADRVRSFDLLVEVVPFGAAAARPIAVGRVAGSSTGLRSDCQY